jgi:hypothetical protein
MTLPTCTTSFAISPVAQRPECAKILIMAREKLTGLPADLREKTIRQFIRLLRKRKPTPYKIWWDHAPRQTFWIGARSTDRIETTPRPRNLPYGDPLWCVQPPLPPREKFHLMRFEDGLVATAGRIDDLDKLNAPDSTEHRYDYERLTENDNNRRDGEAYE